MIKPKDSRDSVDKRMIILAQQAGEAPIKAYVNVGGGTISVGSTLGKRMFQPGLNLNRPRGFQYVDSVMARFIERGIPVIHLAQVEKLAKRYGLPIQPRTVPTPGDGEVFSLKEYNPWLAGGVLLAIMLSLYAFIRSEVGYRLLQTTTHRRSDLFHEPMV